VDPDPGGLKHVDPDPVDPDPQHCLSVIDVQENRKVQPQGGHSPQLPHQAGQSQSQHLTAPGQVLYSLHCFIMPGSTFSIN
jgi:hypothetical protein